MNLFWQTKMKKQKARIIAFITLVAVVLSIGVTNVFAADTNGLLGSSSEQFTPIHYYSFDKDTDTTVVDEVTSGVQNGDIFGRRNPTNDPTIVSLDYSTLSDDEKLFLSDYSQKAYSLSDAIFSYMSGNKIVMFQISNSRPYFEIINDAQYGNIISFNAMGSVYPRSYRIMAFNYDTYKNCYIGQSSNNNNIITSDKITQPPVTSILPSLSNASYSTNLPNIKNTSINAIKLIGTSPLKIINSSSYLTTTTIGVSTSTALIQGYNGTGKARHFDGYNYIQYNNIVTPISKNSISFKIRKSPVSGSPAQYVFSNSTYSDGIYCMINSDGKLYINCNSNSKSFSVITPSSICDNNWHDILYTWDGTTNTNGVNLYVDNFSSPVSTATSPFTEVIPKMNFSIAFNSSLNNIFTGDLDEFKIFNKVIAIPAPVAVKTDKIEGTSNVAISWAAVPSAISYNILRSDTLDTGYTKIGDNTTNTFTDTTAEAGKIYYYVITATNADGAESVNSSRASTIAKPTNLTATAGDTIVNLTWNGTQDAASYDIRRATTAGGPYTMLATVGASSTSYTSTNLKNGTTYYYVVRAITPYGKSGSSNEAFATPTSSSVPVTQNNALVRITMVTNEIKEYEMSSSEVQAFIAWCNSKGASSPTYTINKTYNLGAFTSRKDYIVYDKIANFEVMEY